MNIDGEYEVECLDEDDPPPMPTVLATRVIIVRFVIIKIYSFERI